MKVLTSSDYLTTDKKTVLIELFALVVLRQLTPAQLNSVINQIRNNV